jgi:hypothetical protein
LHSLAVAQVRIELANALQGRKTQISLDQRYVDPKADCCLPIIVAEGGLP